MTASKDLRSRLARYYETEPPLRAPDWVLQTALSTINSIPQRRGLTAPRRYTDMPMFAKVAAAAAVVIAVGALAVWQLAPPGTGGGPSPNPTSTPTASPVPTASARPGPSPYVPPALTESFTSTLHGLSISYPAGWTVQAATAPWTKPGPFFFRDPVGDFLFDPKRTDHLFLVLASQPLGATSFEEWSTVFLAAEGCSETEAVVVDGAAGVIATDCAQALVSTGGRGYVIRLYTSGDDPELRAFDATAWLREILATAQLTPEDAIDTAPSPSP